MNFPQILSAYFTMNLLLAIACSGIFIFSFLVGKLRWPVSASDQLRLHYTLLAAVFTISLAQPFFPGRQIFEPAAKVWSAPSLKTFARDYSDQGYISLPMSAPVAHADAVSSLWLLSALLTLVWGLAAIALDLRRLQRLQRGSFLVRRIHRVRIYVNPSIAVPFSYWLPWRNNIVIPSTLVLQKTDFKIAVAHELQHHRQRDTRWIYLLWLLRVTCVLNPVVYLWSRWISEIQEFACDETLIGRQKVDSQDYARCLIEVAQSALSLKHIPVCATGLTFQAGRNLLKRRIEKMFTTTNGKRRALPVCAGLVLIAAMAATAFAAKGIVQDRRVSLRQAKVMAQKAQADTGFPITVNDLVLKELNRYIGTPEGRDFIRNSLRRMEDYRTVITGLVHKYNVPAEFLAIPITESGYKNMTEKENNTPSHAAGLWEFIPSTARNFGLKVNTSVDERLDVPAETDAAFRYLLSNDLRFGDWLLSIMAYNMGERALENAIETTGSRDPWVLIRDGYEGDKAYLARVMAAILIMKNPDSLN